MILLEFITFQLMSDEIIPKISTAVHCLNYEWNLYSFFNIIMLKYADLLDKFFIMRIQET